MQLVVIFYISSSNAYEILAGFNPVWNETLELNIKVPQVSLIYFSLRDESSYARDPVLALCCIPFNSLSTGKSLLVVLMLPSDHLYR